jgi:hypothetical protein
LPSSEVCISNSGVEIARCAPRVSVPNASTASRIAISTT